MDPHVGFSGNPSSVGYRPAPGTWLIQRHSPFVMWQLKGEVYRITNDGAV